MKNSLKNNITPHLYVMASDVYNAEEVYPIPLSLEKDGNICVISGKILVLHPAN